MTKEMIIAILLFIIGLVLLIKGGDWFVDGATGIAHRFHIPELIIGATIVSIGTTLPEVMVSATAAIENHGEIAYGNAIGSIICNTALIAALSIAIRPSGVKRSTFKIPVIFFFIAAAFYSFTAYFSGHFTRVHGIILLLIFVSYIAFTIIMTKKSLQKEKLENRDNTPTEKLPNETTQEEKKSNKLVKDIVFLLIGAVCIAFGARLLVDNGTIIARELGVPESVIALTFVALGTSLPEFVTAITSLVKGHSSLSFGNIIGANMFNLVFVSGVAITLNPFNVPTNSTLFGINSSLVLDIPLMFGVMLILTIPALIKQKLSRWQGILLLILYASFCVIQFTL